VPKFFWDTDLQAWWILWREIGYEMNVKDVPRTFEEMRDWADEYEKRAMVPSEPTHQLAEVTIGLLLYYAPGFLKGFLKRIIIAFMDYQLRTAMVYEPQPEWIHRLINWGFAVRGFLLRNFALPRIGRITFTSDEKNKWGRYTVNYADNVVSHPHSLCFSPCFIFHFSLI
jgi:hypothetical protein